MTESPSNSGFRELGTAADALLARCWTSDNQSRRVSATIWRALRFAERGFGLTGPSDFDPGVARAFVNAPEPDGAAPSLATRHLRRSALRLMFRAARSSGLASGDPTLDLELPPRSPLPTRPLRTDEVVVCRAAAAWNLAETRHATAWALAEATARTVELAQATRSDLDLKQERVWIHGGRTTTPRWAPLTWWGLEQLDRQVQRSQTGDDLPLVYRGSGPPSTGQVSSSIAIADVLERAGLGHEPDVRPASVAAWAGRQVLAETGRIDVVARRLGMRSLDRAAKFIAWDWSGDES